MNFKGIDRWSLKYAIIKLYVNLAHNRIFYRNISVIGKENLPKDTPLFFAPNHQNALMDALIILCSLKAQPVFIARADIFKNKIIARILIALKILPAYRIRDGKENLKKNEEIFDISVKILENKNILALFPEATHTDKRQLRILKKGVQRIVFQAEEKNNFQLGVKIVPIGIYYSNYWNFKSDIQIIFGKPIEIDEYLKIYQENQQKAMLALRDKISEELKPLMIHIKNNEYYDLFEFMREVYNNEMRKMLGLSKNLYNEFLADKKIIDALDITLENKPELFENLNTEANHYQKELKRLNIRHWVVEKNRNVISLILKSIGLVIAFPLFLYGFVNNFIPYYLPRPLTKKLEDKQFTSSINYVAGLIFYPLFYLILFSMVWIFTKVWWIKFVYLISLPISGVLAFAVHRFFIKTKAQWKFYFAKSKKQIIEQKNNIFAKMKAIVENQ
jgi:1-acyl-sn-glycerol-3-phosphate acyltransferase